MAANRMSRLEVFIGTWNTTGEVLAGTGAAMSISRSERVGSVHMPRPDGGSRSFPGILLAVVLGLCAWSASAAAVELQFVASAPAFEAATEEYRQVWATEGARMVEALERYAGVPLPDRRIRVIVFEGVSDSGRRGGPLHLRASYAVPVKRATLAHELLHRQVDEIEGLAACYPEIHDVMAVMLFELWSELWGRAFAVEQARVESARSRRYLGSWTKALALSRSERRSVIAGIASCRPGRTIDAGTPPLRP
jgi:hypothetical protein